MPPFGANFTKVTRGRDDEGQDVLFIEGKTDDRDDELTAMFVNLADRDALPSRGDGVIGLPAPEHLREVPVENPLGSIDWVAVLSEAPLPETGEWVVVIGLAERDGQPAFLWVETLQVEERGASALRAA